MIHEEGVLMNSREFKDQGVENVGTPWRGSEREGWEQVLLLLWNGIILMWILKDRDPRRLENMK